LRATSGGAQTTERENKRPNANGSNDDEREKQATMRGGPIDDAYSTGWKGSFSSPPSDTAQKRTEQNSATSERNDDDDEPTLTDAVDVDNTRRK